MQMIDFDFGTIGLKIGDKITFNKGNKQFIVASGNGTPGNGSTLVSHPGRYNCNYFSFYYSGSGLHT